MSQTDFFQKFFTNKGFNKDAFVKYVLKIKQKGMKRTVTEKGIISKESFFNETLDVLGSMVHAIKYYSDEAYKKDKNSRRKVRIRYTARECKSAFQKHPELNNLSLIEELRKVAFEERAIQRANEGSSRFADSVKFRSTEDIVNILLSRKIDEPSDVVITPACGAFVIRHNGKNLAMMYNDQKVILQKSDVIRSNGSSHSSREAWCLSREYQVGIEEYKKNLLKEKMNSIFSPLA